VVSGWPLEESGFAGCQLVIGTSALVNVKYSWPLVIPRAAADFGCLMRFGHRICIWS